MAAQVSNLARKLLPRALVNLGGRDCARGPGCIDWGLLSQPLRGSDGSCAHGGVNGFVVLFDGIPMAKVHKLNKDDPLAGLPRWGRTLAERYYTKTVSTFVLYGAVRDLQPLALDDGSEGFGTLKSFLADELFGGREHVIF